MHKSIYMYMIAVVLQLLQRGGGTQVEGQVVLSRECRVRVFGSGFQGCPRSLHSYHGTPNPKTFIVASRWLGEGFLRSMFM